MDGGMVMNRSWSRVLHYSMEGWRQASIRLFFLLFIMIFAISAWGRPPFWLTFSSLAPFLLIYFPLAGFLMELLDRDWEDWHLW